MSAYYDHIAKEYQHSRQLPFRLYGEVYTYLNLIGDVTGLAVLDLACGDGIYSRVLKRRGAARVVGVDISTKMIELAQAAESREPLGIEYLVSSAEDLGKISTFDLVVASFLLNHAQTREQLQQMCASIAANLKPGGRFVAVNNNQEQPPETYPYSSIYGFRKDINGPLQPGQKITYTLINPDSQQEVKIDDYYLSTATYEEVLSEVGLEEICWHSPQVSPTGIEKFGQDYWQSYLDYPFILFLTCQKQN